MGHFLFKLCFLLATTIQASFLALGPPAAPKLENLGSASLFNEADFEFSLRNHRTLLTSNATSLWNVTLGANNTDSLGLQQKRVNIGPGHFWLSDSSYGHKMPYAGDGYQVFRNVKDPKYRATGNGKTDDYAAIQAAITDGNRCGANCNSTSTKGAIIYFPPGTYAISQPLVQYYYTAFVGDPNARPIIKPSPSFKGMALIDTDVYIEDGNGANWWVNQNNFYRQIRNFRIDMRNMENRIRKGASFQGEGEFPVGIHWQVSQTCTLQNVEFILPQRSDSRHIGILQENGSGGFVSDLTFLGGKYCWVAGSQQYTGRNIKFRGCDTAIYMLWDWGWTWKNIDVQNSRVAIDASDVSKKPDPDTKRYQGTGSLTIVDSKFVSVDEVIRIPRESKSRPAIFIDNLEGSGVQSTVKVDKGAELLSGRNISGQWGLGWRFTDKNENGIETHGPMVPTPQKPNSLLRSGKFFERSKPQYELRVKDDFISVLRFGANNDGSLASAKKNTESINNAMRASAETGKVILFPSGVYPVDDTIIIPTGARIQGALWSQIMAVGSAFKNPKEPKAVTKVGRKEGDKGVIEISDIAFTTKGNSAGAVLVEWNVHEGEQGSAAMWDVLIRVGGAQGTDLDFNRCPWTRSLAKNAKTDVCMASSLLLHVKPQASIYMENTWLWVADHDIEDATQRRVNVYRARGALIESKGPSWFHSVSNEHSTLYNWQLLGAENIYLGQIQSETPYFQAGQIGAEYPYPPGDSQFDGDPEFGHCISAPTPESLAGKLGDKPTSISSPSSRLDTCREAWALRIIDSRHIYVYGGGFYSFFNNYLDTCAKSEKGVCQQRLVDTSYSEEIWIYNLYTVGAEEVVSPQGDRYQPTRQKQLLNGFATALSSWLLLAGPDKSHIGGSRGGRGGSKKGMDGDTCANLPHNAQMTACNNLEFQQRIDFPAVEIWDSFNASAKWCDVLRMVNTKMRDAYSFDNNQSTLSQQIATYLGNTNAETFNCGTGTSNGCKPPQCEPSMDAPGVLIMNSLAHLSEWQAKLSDAWETTLTHALPKAGVLRKNFAPERAQPKDDALKIILDIIGLGFLAVSHGAWHNTFKPSVKAFANKHDEMRKRAGEAAAAKARADALAKNGKNPGQAKSNAEIDVLAAKAAKDAEERVSVGSKNIEKRADTLRDWVNMGPSSGFSLWKDTMTKSKKDEAAWAVAEYVEGSVKTFQNIIGQQTSDLFDGRKNGSDDHLHLLDTAIRTGAFSRLTPDQIMLKDKFNISEFMTPVLYGSIIPQIWKMEELRFPVLIMEGSHNYPKTLPPKMEGKKEDIIWGAVPGKPGQSNELIHIKDLNKVTTEYDGKVLFLLQSYNCEKFNPKQPTTAPSCIRGICRPTGDEILNITTEAKSNGSTEQVSRDIQSEQQPQTDAAPQFGCSTKDHGLSMLPGWEKLSNYSLTTEDIAISAYRGWQVNNGNLAGKKDGEKIVKNFNDYARKAFESTKDSDLADVTKWKRLPGLSNVPVCSWATWKANHKAWGNSQRKDKMPCDEYPCCPIDTLTKYGLNDPNHDQGYLGVDENIIAGKVNPP